MRAVKSILLFVAIVAIAPGLVSADEIKSFRATAVQIHKGQQVQSGKLYVSGAKSRFESVEHGRQIVKITLPEQKVMRILFPQEKMYVEVKAPDDAPLITGKSKTPCPPVPGLTCQKVADAKYGDLDVQQWEQYHAPSKTKSTLWWEPVRNLVVRQEFPDGRIMQMSMTGTVEYEGRPAESWDVVIADTQGQQIKSNKLIDVELDLIVKDSVPANDISRELRDLKVVEPNPDWFAVPQGYQKIDPNQVRSQ